MHFVRLAGCSVGKPVGTVQLQGLHGQVGGELTHFISEPVQVAPTLKTGTAAWLCHTYDGRPFWCDTDFNRHEIRSVQQVLDATWEDRICLTGGEPLVHIEKVRALVEHAELRGKQIHVETSGTIDLPDDIREFIWVSVSPKLGATEFMMHTANEIKLLVDAEFDLERVPAAVEEHFRVFVQPINDELAINYENFRLCLDILRARPHWRLSIQQHKQLGLR